MKTVSLIQFLTVAGALVVGFVWGYVLRGEKFPGREWKFTDGTGPSGKTLFRIDQVSGEVWLLYERQIPSMSGQGHWRLPFWYKVTEESNLEDRRRELMGYGVPN